MRKVRPDYLLVLIWHFRKEVIEVTDGVHMAIGFALANAMMVEGEDLPEKVRAELGDANIPLAIDAVAGKATLSLGGILSEEGTVVNYGLLSGEPCQLTADIVVFKEITLTGFWLTKTFDGMTVDAKQQLCRERNVLYQEKF